MSFIFIQENAYENVVWKMAAILSRPQCVNRLHELLPDVFIISYTLELVVRLMDICMIMWQLYSTSVKFINNIHVCNMEVFFVTLLSKQLSACMSRKIVLSNLL